MTRTDHSIRRFSAIILVVSLVSGFILRYSRVLKTDFHTGSGKAKVMGADVRLRLFNVTTYHAEVVPAYSEFMQRRNTEPLTRLLQVSIHQLPRDKQLAGPLVLSQETYLNDIGILNGTVFYSSKSETLQAGIVRRTTPQDMKIFVQGSIGPELVELLCVERRRDVNPDQDMSRTQLIPYLYQRSRWIEDIFTFANTLKGEVLDPTMGESTQLFTREELRRFADELSKVPRPEHDPRLQGELDNLSLLLKLALEDPNLTLALTIT
jgi:hypothetical protein